MEFVLASKGNAVFFDRYKISLWGAFHATRSDVSRDASRT